MRDLGADVSRVEPGFWMLELLLPSIWVVFNPHMFPPWSPESLFFLRMMSFCLSDSVFQSSNGTRWPFPLFLSSFPLPLLLPPLEFVLEFR